MIKSFQLEEQDNSRFIVFQLCSNKLIDHFSIEVMRRNNIIGLLPCSIRQLDSDRVLRYSVGKRVSLTNVLQKPITEEKLFDILTNLTTTMNCIEDYLLVQSQVILDTEAIYVDIDTGKIGLVYSPIEIPENEVKSFTRFIKEILIDLRLETSSGQHLANKIYSYFNENWSVSVSNFKEFLQEVEKSKNYTIDDKIIETPIFDSPIHLEDSFTKDNQISPNSEPLIPLLINDDFTVSTKSVPVMKEKKKQSFLTRFFKKENHEKEFSSFHSVLNQSLEKNKQFPQNEINPIIPINTSLPSYTTNGTPILKTNIDSPTTILNSYIQPYLIRKKTCDRFYLSNEIHTVGSEKGKVDIFISNNPAISRFHATFTKKNGSVYIKDCNSTNGTYLNNKKIVAGSEKKINQNDSITLANEIFEFRAF